jgi:twitching motility protein PilT
MTLRKLPSVIPTFDDLSAPDAIRRFAELERGLVLVTGPTGSGKSTTLAAIINAIITGSARHVITLEDPIEFRFPTDRASLVNQREYGSSFSDFPEGIRDSLRQDPDVILVGEMRDKQTIAAALTAASTGHLCLGTLHTSDAPQTVARIVNAFDSSERDEVRAQLAQMLKGVVSQTLLPRAGNKGRVAAYEILVANPAIATNLRKVGGENALKQTMQTAAREGMVTLEASLASLVRRGVVRKDEAEFRAQDVEEFQRALDFYEST